MEYAKITVRFPDKSIKSYSIESRQTVLSFKKIVANSLDIEDERFFGFYYQDDQKNNYWLCDEKIVFHYDFMKNIINRIVFNFAFKYLYHFDYWLADESTKNLFYYQLKQQLYDGDFECDSDRCFRLLAMTLLLDNANITSHQDIQKMNIISAHLFAKHPSIDYCIEQIMIRIKEFQSISKCELLKRFIVHILEIPFQLTHFFFAKNFNSATIVIAINNNGFFETDKCSKSTVKLTYAWSEITNIGHHKSRINIDIQDPSHRSSIRRKSSALSISYDLTNNNLAKSFVYLAKDTVNFLTQTFESIRVMSTLTPRRNPNNLKKTVHNTYSGKQEKFRMSTQNAFIPENDPVISRSSSKISLTSSNYAGSGITNDSTSLQLDDEALNFPVNVPEKQKIFVKLNERRKCIINELNKKVKEAVQNCILENNITKKMPSDLAILDPKSQIKLTKFSLRTPLVGGEVSTYQNKKNGIMEEIETLQNIIDKLKENEKKHRIEIKQKTEEINCCVKRMQILESENANEQHMRNNTRSNSMGSLFPYPNGNVPIINGHAPINGDGAAPMTEPRSRKNTTLFLDRNSSGSNTLKSFNDKYTRMKNSDENCINNTTSKAMSPLRPSDVKHYTSVNQSQFQRFTSTRTQIKGLPSKLQITFLPKRNPSDNQSNSNSSVDSNYSVDNTESLDQRSSNSNTDDYTKEKSETSEDQCVPLRFTGSGSIIAYANRAVRDSREINLNRVNTHSKIANMKKNSRSLSAANNNSNSLNGGSLDELREDVISESSESDRYYAIRYRKEFCEASNPVSKLTYHHSKRDSKPINLTRGKQPSIIRKAARPSVSQE